MRMACAPVHACGSRLRMSAVDLARVPDAKRSAQRAVMPGDAHLLCKTASRMEGAQTRLTHAHTAPWTGESRHPLQQPLQHTAAAHQSTHSSALHNPHPPRFPATQYSTRVSAATSGDRPGRGGVAPVCVRGSQHRQLPRRLREHLVRPATQRYRLRHRADRADAEVPGPRQRQRLVRCQPGLADVRVQQQCAGGGLGGGLGEGGALDEQGGAALAPQRRLELCGYEVP